MIADRYVAILRMIDNQNPLCIYASGIFKLLIFRLFLLLMSCIVVRAIILAVILVLNPSNDLA